MQFKTIVLVFAALASVGLFSTAADAGNPTSTLHVAYFALSNPGPNSDYYGYQPPTRTDFGVCCTSGPATSEDITVGSSLSMDGMPVAGDGSDVVDKNATTNEILWWTPLQNGISRVGTSTITVPFSNYMFYSATSGPNQTSGDGNYYETAILSGLLTGEGKDVTISVGSDDDALIYVDGTYKGGVEGVTCCGTATIDLGTITGTHPIEVFYADRAQVNAYLSWDVTNAITTAVPEPATWAMLLLGFFGIGFMVRGSRHKDAVAVA